MDSMSSCKRFFGNNTNRTTFAWVTAAFVAIVGGALSIALRAADAPTAAAPASVVALDQRIPWTTGKVVGSPDPPDPFVTRRLFPNLKFYRPLDLAFEPGGQRAFVLEHGGKLWSFIPDPAVSKPDLAFDIKQLSDRLSKIPQFDNAQTFGFTFDPDYARNHYVYLMYVSFFPGKPALEYARAYPQNKTASRVSRFTMVGNPPTIDPGSELPLIAWPGNGHNGGCLKFGADGDLYISTGDNGDPNPPDPHQVGQDVGDLRAKILRIDPRHPSPGLNYTIPADNPFAKMPAARGEVFAYGLRNPWRFSIDPLTQDIWAGDVGWELWESVDHIVPGGNYGWSINEGPQRVYPDHRRGPTPILGADIALPHTEAASLTGGVVYHGARLPGLQNQYLFGDWETRRLWAAPVQTVSAQGASTGGPKLGPYRTIAQTDLRIVNFGVDNQGEVYLVDYQGGGLWRIDPNPSVGNEKNFPRLLSQTGLFADVARQAPNPGVIPFAINTPQWVDGTRSLHFIAAPPGPRVFDNEDGRRIYPANTVAVRTLCVTAGQASPNGPPAAQRPVETQLLHFDGRQWHGYTYRWNDAGTDASLVGAAGLDASIPLPPADGGQSDAHTPAAASQPAAPAAPIATSPPAATLTATRQPWHFNSRAQCMTCHSAWTGYTIAFSEQQLDHDQTFQTANGPVTTNALAAFRQLGLIPPADPGKPQWTLVNPLDEHQTLDDRARSYLHVNCSTCHRFGGGGTALIDLRRETSLRESHLISLAMLGTFNLPDAQVVCPGDPARSVLYYRMAKTGAGRMPHLGSLLTDEPGLQLIATWIASLGDQTKGLEPNPATLDAVRAQTAALAILKSHGLDAQSTAAVQTLVSGSDGALRLSMLLRDWLRDPAARAAHQPVINFVFQRAGDSATPAFVRDVLMRFVPPSPDAVAKVGSTPDVPALLALRGNPERGGKVFHDMAGGLCARCHIVDGKGADFGPDLSHIGTKYSKADLLDNILYPSKTIAPGYATQIIKTRDANVVMGFVVSEDDKEIVVKDAERHVLHIKKANIAKRALQAISAMPEGLLADLEPQQAADLLAYLAERK